MGVPAAPLIPCVVAGRPGVSLCVSGPGWAALTVWVAWALWLLLLLLLLLLWWLWNSVARVLLLLLLLPVCRSAPGTPVAPVAFPPRGLLVASSIVSVLLSTVASLLLAVLLLSAVRSGAPRHVGYSFSIGSDAC